jgi:hypothetical protein
MSQSILRCVKVQNSELESSFVLNPQLLQQAFGEDAMRRTQVFDRFRRFEEGRTSVESDLRSGLPSTSRTKELIAKVRTIVRNNRRLTVREISDDCVISVGSCDAISSRKTAGNNGGKAIGPCTMAMRPHTLHNAPAHTSQCASTHFTMRPHTLHNAPGHTSKCARTHFASCATVFGQTRHRSVAAAAINHLI